MELFLINSKKKEINITGWVSSITLKGEYRSCCRELSFGVINNNVDKYTHLVGVYVGDHIKLVENNTVMFYGVIWDKTKITDGKEIDFLCKDLGIYLTKNRCSYKFTNAYPQAVVDRICTDYGISKGTIAKGQSSITRKLLGVMLYDAIMTAYTLSSKKSYMVRFMGDKLNVEEKGVVLAPNLESSINLLTLGVTESLANMVNQVNVYNKDDKLIKTFQNAENIKQYGKMSEYIKITDDKTNFTEMANKTLQGLEHKITATNLGDVNYITGRAVILVEPSSGLKGKFYIDADEHNWKNGIYTNKLTLNFKNLMDSKESGSSE